MYIWLNVYVTHLALPLPQSLPMKNNEFNENFWSTKHIISSNLPTLRIWLLQIFFLSLSKIHPQNMITFRL